MITCPNPKPALSLHFYGVLLNVCYEANINPIGATDAGGMRGGAILPTSILHRITTS